MQITKGQGAVLTLIPITLYLMPYWVFVHNNDYAAQLTLFFLLGVIFLFLVKIEPGTQANLLFFNKATKTYWEDGLCLVPSFVPSLHNVGIHLFWGLEKPITERDRLGVADPEFLHHLDHRKMTYSVHVNTSLLTAQANRISGNIFDWYFNIDRGDPNLIYQRLGTRMIILALILGACANAFFPINKSNRPSWVNLFSFENKSTAEVFVNLAKGDKPTMPEDEYFTASTTGSWSCTKVAEKKYCHYMDIGDKIPAIPVEESLCVAVPTGKKIAFKTGRRPVYVINMENRVLFEKKIERFEVQDRLKVLVSELRNPMKPPYSVRATWEALHGDWGATDTSAFVIARALPYDRIPDGRVLGGLVCF